MVAFQSATQEDLFQTTVRGLTRLGYRDGLIARDYGFLDYFTNSERSVPIAAFGQSPPSYKTACFGVLLPQSGLHGARLVERHKALGSPFHFEIANDRVTLWVVGQSIERTRIVREFQKDELRAAFQSHDNDWSPESVMRAKNIAFPRRNPQLDFFDFGLIPALEEQIEKKLDPILRSALAAAKQSYRDTSSANLDERDLFRLAFRLLAGKVLHDRGVGVFPGLTRESGPDVLLQHVAEHYGEPAARILNIQARQSAFDEIWSQLDFRNLSVDVLTFIWSTTLVTEEIRDALGIHTTPRSVAKYVVDHLPRESFADLDDRDGLVVEPCCGSAIFLVEAMQRIRDQLPAHLTAEQRHDRFRRALVGIEQETFGIEVARLCLTLADFPERNRWQLHEENVFTSASLPTALRRARVVLCNPPFQDVATRDPVRTSMQSPHKPVELIRRVLLDLHPEGVLGFVLPRKFIDGGWYRESRHDIAARFASIELVSLPDIAFRQSEAEHETVLLLATQPRGTGTSSSSVRHRRVSKPDWPLFVQMQRATSEDAGVKSAGEAAISIAIPHLGEVWSYLAGTQTLGDIATTSRGIEWNDPLRIKGEETGHRQRLVLDEPVPGETLEGVPPLAKINAFQKPKTKHLVVVPKEQRRNAYKRPWDLPKVILNAARRSRGHWRISAFPDFGGLTCYRTFLAVWPKDPAMTVALSAILNGPVANAFAATKEGFNITQKSLKTFPVPRLSESQLHEIDAEVVAYIRAIKHRKWQDARGALLRIDATVLEGYDLPPRIERKLLDFFHGMNRPIPADIEFGNYFPDDFGPCFSLGAYLAHDFSKSRIENVLAAPPPPSEVMEALRASAEIHSE